MDDQKIINLYLERNEEALKETEKKYSRLCHRICTNILHNEADAEECVNDTYLGLWNSIPPHRPSRLTAFVATLARRQALKRLEYNTAAKRDAGIQVDFSELEGVLSDADTADGVTEERLGELISSFLQTQKPAVRDVFMRKYWFFDSVEDIARKYSFSESRVKSMLFHTRNKLRHYLISKGVHI